MLRPNCHLPAARVYLQGLDKLDLHAGEIACGYASGCFTREQAMLIAYHRGRLPTERGISSGLMAATGLSAEQCKQRVAGTNVVMACDNSPTSTTVSGAALPLLLHGYVLSYSR